MRISDWSSDVCSSDLLLRLDLGTIEGGFRRIGAAARHRVAVVNCCVCFDRIVDLLVESRRSQPLVTAHIPFTTDVRVPQFTILQERVATIEDRKSTRLTPVTTAQLVCRLNLENKKENITNKTLIVTQG